MFLDGFIKFSANKENKKSSPTPGAVVVDYQSGDKELNCQISAFLANKTSAEHCLEAILHHMAYYPQLQVQDNICILECLKDILDGATWMPEWNPNKSGDYDPDNPGRWLGCIASAYYDYNDGDNTKYEDLRAIIEKRDYTPLEALKMIEEHWDKIYKGQGCYEAIEFCLLTSENHSKPPYISSSIRDIGYKLGPVFNQIKMENEKRWKNK